MMPKTDLAKEYFLDMNAKEDFSSDTQGICWETFILISDLSNRHRKSPDLEDRTTAAGGVINFDCKISERRLTEDQNIKA